MPWQRQVVEVATEYDPATGRPFWSEVFVTTPRQSGKTLLIAVLLIDRCLSWGEPQYCVWTGQDGKSIRKKWLREIVPMLQRSDLAPLLSNVRRSNGDEAVEWHTGSVIELLPTTEEAGHGMTIDFVVMDELFADTDSRRDQALGPAMITRPHAQMFTCSTAGTDTAVVYNRRVRTGREQVATDAERGMAYFEWSAPDDWDPWDDDSYWEFHPALGHTQTLDAILLERAKLAEVPEEFARAFGNRPNLEAGGLAIPAAAWQRVVQANATPDLSTAVLAVDIGPDREVAAIAAVDADGVAELLEYDTGVGWVVAKAAELSDKYGAPVVFDAGGPARALDGLSQLRRAHPLTGGDVIDACQSFYDAIGDGKVTVRRDEALDRAAKGVELKHVADKFCWSRKASKHDVTPLYAVTLAAHVARQPRRRPQMFVAFD